MPELPEVEVVGRSLCKLLRGDKVTTIKEHFPGLLTVSGGQPVFPAQFIGFHRHGKVLQLNLSGDQQLVVHLRMTGNFSLRDRSVPVSKHIHVDFLLESGSVLGFKDVRRFGRLWWLGSGQDWMDLPMLRRHGPDALSVSENDFVQSIRTRRRMLKPLLLDQSFLAGIGNIYADEMLYRSGLHPERVSNRVSARKLASLYQAMLSILKESITEGGTTIADFRNADGKTGGFTRRLLVYGHQGEPCCICGTTIRKIVVGQRGTHFCPRCQRK